MRALVYVLVLTAGTAYAGPRRDLCAAAKAGKTRRVAELVSQVSDLDNPACEDEYECGDPAPVWCAVQGGSLESLKLLVKEGAKLEGLEARYGGEPEDLLIAAARLGHTEIVDWLIAKGRFKLDHASESGWTPLHAAAEGKQLAVVSRLIARGVKVDARNQRGVSPLMIAAGKASVPVLDALLAAGADATATDKDGRTALGFAEERLYDTKPPADLPMALAHLAAKAKDFELADRDGVTALMRAVGRGKRDVATQWLAWGANVDAVNKRGETALHLAARRPEMLDLLLARRPKLDVQDSQGLTPLHVAVWGGAEAVGPLLAAKVPLEVRDREGRTPLLAAFRDEKYAPARDRLLAAGANVNAADAKGWTPLRYAIVAGDAKLTALLLDRKADPNAADPEGETPLMFADDRKIAELLLARGARVDARSKKGWSPLLASGAHGADLMQLYLDKGADPRQVTADGWTALMVAARDGYVAQVKGLLAKGTPVDSASSDDGWTALHLAAYHRRAEIVGLLLAAKANVTLTTRQKETALHIAFSLNEVRGPVESYSSSYADPVPVATRLLDAGCPIDAVDSRGRTALMLAVENKADAAAKFLISRGAKPAAPPLVAPVGPRYPFLSERRITPADIANLSVEELVLARNEVFARHGYTFKRAELAAYFAKQPWYKPDPAYDERSLTEIERDNIRVLLEAEKALKKK